MTVADWLLLKTELVRATALSRDALHIYLGLFVQLTAALLLRRRLGDWLPWLAVFALAVGNEIADLWVEIWPQHAFQAASAIHDLVNTMILPTALLLFARHGGPLMGRS